MKIKALKEHKCFCCPKKIMKGEECIICFTYPKNPEKNEFDVFYVCMKCGKVRKTD